MRITLDHTEDAADSIKTFWFKSDRTIKYTPGQFIELIIPHSDPDKRGIKRWFTLSSSPSESLLSITTKLASENGSTFKDALFNLEPGASIMMSEPMGDFVLPKDKNVPVVFVAGGIGVTPMRSMIKWLYDNQEQRTLHLIYAASTIDEVAFRNLFNEYGIPTDIVLSSAPRSWKGRSGRLDAKTVLDISPNVDGKLYFISGPEKMVESLGKDLENNGVDKRRIVGDYFPNYGSI
jgi:glycine betaine catabolism B